MKHSLHFGLNRVDPSAYGGWPGLLNACENDASGLASALSGLGYDARLLLNENASLSNFKFEISNLAATAVRGDHVVITYSGHGGQEYSLSEADGFNETLCLSDGQLVDDDFVRLLAQFAPGVNVVVILDCCHAGGEDRSAFRPAKRRAPASTWIHRPQTRDARLHPLSASIALFCACLESETASDGDKFGAWTGALLAALPAAVTVQTWFTVAAAHCPHGQHPILRPLGEPGVLTQPLA